MLTNFTRLLLFLFIASSSADTMASSYYVSVDGDDSNNGTSKKTAWKTIDKANTAKLSPGDGIFFRRGDVFSGQLQIGDSGKQGQAIVIGAYGTGAIPVLCGAVTVTSWTAYKSGIYVAKVLDVVTSVYMNDGLQFLARYPNTGFSTIQRGDKTSLLDGKGLPGRVDVTGATVRVRAVDWQYEIMKVAFQQSNQISFTQKMMYQCSPGYGYFLDNTLTFLDSPGEWFYDQYDKLLYYFPSNNITLSKAKMDVTIHKYGVTIKPGVSFITIRDLKFEKYEKAAIYGMNGSSWVSISGCSIRSIDVYGISLELNTRHYCITSNLIEDIRGRGISTLESSDNDISANVVRRIGLCPGYGFEGVNNAIGIAVLKTESCFLISEAIIERLKQKDLQANVLSRVGTLVNLPYPDEKFLLTALTETLGKDDAALLSAEVVKLVKEEMAGQKMESCNNRVAYNLIEDTGYAGIRLDGRDSVAECNVIKNTILHMNDGGALYCWAQTTNYTFNNVFRSNIIMNVVGHVVCPVIHPPSQNGGV